MTHRRAGKSGEPETPNASPDANMRSSSNAFSSWKKTGSERPRAQLHPREREKERKGKKGLRELDELYTVATTSPRRRQQKRRKKTRLREQERTDPSKECSLRCLRKLRHTAAPSRRQRPPATACLRADSSPSGRSRPALRAQQRQRKSRPQGKQANEQTS